MQLDTQTKLSSITIGLHWIVGLTIIGLLAVGLYMEENEVYALYPWHKSFGVLITVFVLARVSWRLRNGWPKPVRKYAPIEHYLAKVVHWLLIIGTVLMPVSGFLMSSLGGHGVDLFGIELVAKNPDPANPGQVIPHDKNIAGLAHSAHGLGGNIMIIALLLHISGAIKHHVLDKDGTLKRMLGKQ